jgi:uncharacterized integral membrane protein
MTGPTYEDRAGRTPEPGGGAYEPGPVDPGAAAPGSVPPDTEPPAGVPPEAPAADTRPSPGKVPQRTRVSGIWVASIAAVVVLLILLIFILQNGDRVKINIFGANPTLPLGVALLLAAVLGALLVALIGAARVVQLRHTARKIARRSR